MASYDIFFFGVCFFLLGITLSSAGFTFGIVMGALVISAFFVFRVFTSKQNRKRFLWLAMLSQIMLIGALYATYNEIYKAQNTHIPFGEEVQITGVISRSPIKYSGSLRWIMELDEPFRGRVQVTSRTFPRVTYGDRVVVTGLIRLPEDSVARILKKDGVAGIVSFPKSVEVVAHESRAGIRTVLFSLREKTTDVFKKTLPREEAAFLSGVLLGERSELSEKFETALERTGTIHIIALSGYNITVIVSLVMSTLLFFTRRRIAFIITLIAITAFVIMTGSEASVVRAAVMGGIALFARETGRTFDMRNAVAGAAFVMALENPDVLVFDVGFQLSFLALLGIVYLRPALVHFLRINKDPGIYAWKENAATTAAAQLAVAPLLVSYFGSLSVISLAVNVLVLGLIPIIMGFGFVLALVGSVSLFITLPISWISLLLLRFETGIISFFGELSPQLHVALPWGWWIIYYALLGYGIKKNLNLSHDRT